MITFVWGIDFVKPDAVINGFAVHETFEEFGFKDGDKITKFNGEVPLDVTDVNKHLFLRGITSLDVIHEDGSEETLSIPEDIGSIMWEKGVMEPFSARTIPIVDTVVVGSPAEKFGILKNDRIIAVNNTPVFYWQEFSELASKATEKELTLDVERDGVIKSISIVPNEDKTIGVSNYQQRGFTIDHKDYSFLESISKGNSLAIWTLKDYITQFKYVFTKKGATSIGGFIAIGNIFPSTWSWKSFWGITAFLSIMLGFMNLLPIPGLDGGHALFTLVEMITGKKLSDKAAGHVQTAGMIILLTLMALTFGKDIYQLVVDKLL